MDFRSSLLHEPYGRYGAFHGHVRKEMSIMNEQNHIGTFKRYLAA